MAEPDPTNFQNLAAEWGTMDPRQQHQFRQMFGGGGGFQVSQARANMWGQAHPGPAARAQPEGFDPVNNPEHYQWLAEEDRRLGREHEWWRYPQQGRYQQLQARQEPMIRRMHQGAFAGALDTFRSREGYSNRQAAGQMGFQGLAPSTFTSLIQPELDYNRAGGIAGLRAGAQAGAVGDTAQLDLNITEALNTQEQFYDRQRLEKELGQLSSDATRDAAKSAAKGSLVGGALSAVGSIAGAAIFASDERVKEDIHYEGRRGGHKVYSWRWRQPRSFGVLAQEAEKIQPEAVLTRGDGMKFVDYSRLNLE